MEDKDIQYCKLCLVTDVKLFSMNTFLLEAYSQLAQVDCEKYQMYVCYECVSLLQKYNEFRLKCLRALNVLSSVNTDHSKISKEVVKNLDRNFSKLRPNLTCCKVLQIEICEQCSMQKDYIEIKESPDKDIESDIKIEIGLTLPEFDFKIKNSGIQDDTLPEFDFKIKNSGIQDDMGTNDTHSSNYNLSDSGHFELCIIDNDSEMKLIPKRNIKLKKHKERKKNASNKKSDSKDNFNDFKDYVTIVNLTADDAMKEIQLRKETINYKSNAYKCDLCCKGFSIKTVFDNHMKNHSPECGSFECEYCHLRFYETQNLRKHKLRSHQRKFICKICPFFCSSLAKARTHMNVHKGRKFDCNVCLQTFSTDSTLLFHKRNRHKHLAEVTCAICGSSFLSLRGLQMHKTSLHKNEGSAELLGPKCTECDIQFATETAYKRHLVISSKHDVSNGCEYCGKVFPTKKELIIHSKLHPNRKQYKDMYYMQRWNGFKPPAACTICDAWLTSISEFRTHIVSQHPQCGVSKFKQIESHEAGLVCEFCGKVFKYRCILQEHIAKHKGLRYECKECGKTFARRASLNIHQRNYHSDIKKIFQCDLCKKEYYVKSALAKHMNAHFGIKPYKCQLCDNKFYYEFAMRKHMDHVHFKKPWPKRDRTKRTNN